MVLIQFLLDHVKRSQSVRLVLIGIVCLLVGARAFSAAEHIGYGTALYWAVTTATTVGYGDVIPHNGAGQVIAVFVMLTTIPLFAAAFAVFAGAVASTHLRRLLGVEHAELKSGGVVIYGMHPAVPGIVADLLAAHRDVVVVTTADRSSLPDEVHVIVAAPTSEEAVRRARPERAAQVLVTGTNDADVLVTAVLVHEIAPGVPMLTVAASPSVCRALRDLGATAALSGDELLGHTLAKSLEAPHAGELLLRIMDSEGFELREVPVEPSAAGRPLSALRAELSGLVLGAVHAGKVVMGVADDPVLADGDRLLVLEPAR